MTSAVILTDRHAGVALENNKPVILNYVQQLKKITPEIIIISDSPMDYLPFVKSSARILSYYKHEGSVLSGLHTALTLCKEKDIWLLHENIKLPPLRLLKHLQHEKRKLRNPNLILPFGSCSSPYYGIYDKMLLPMIAEAHYTNSRINDLLRVACFAQPTYRRKQAQNSHAVE
ncbi:hypothetical protein ACFFJY_06445 [Fictibacillus aquaticus]|uniref:Glycosyltransferase 2-like domain-containing protein n=1 Tax=Fictibacillus aquaticus TaxID=2021314 RepID=A0A235FB41_9BACL|nr:hypothetical protein [Fictibacillus aquaticus]OYD58157.1 hypothetical protein CGZ90_09760 [Fictibacillus aquaticus]